MLRHPQRGWPWRILLPLCAASLAFATWAAYRQSFATPFVFDAGLSIVENSSIRKLWPLWPVLNPDLPGATVEGRPLLNFSFALSYAFGGLNPFGYHVTNFCIHLWSGLLLFGILRRTLLLPRFGRCPFSGSIAIPFAASLIWLVHPPADRISRESGPARRIARRALLLHDAPSLDPRDDGCASHSVDHRRHRRVPRRNGIEGNRRIGPPRRAAL